MSSFISNFKKLPLSFIGSLILFLAVQSLIVRNNAFWEFCYSFTESTDIYDPLRLESVLRIIKKDDDRKKILLIGSSQTREGYDMYYLNDTFKNANAVFYNLGTVGNDKPFDVLINKDRILAKNPDVIIYMPYIGSFYTVYNAYEFNRMTYDFHLKLVPHMVEHLGTEEILSYRRAIFESFLGDASIFYKYRDQFQLVFYNGAKHYAGFKDRPDPLRNLFYTENKPQSYFDFMIAKSNQNRYKINKHTKFNQESFKLFAKDVVEQGVDLIVVSGPTHPLITRTYQREIDEMYNSFLSDQAQNIGFTYLPEYQLPDFRNDDFVDFTHLNESGRNKFSKFIADYLRYSTLAEELVKSK